MLPTMEEALSEPSALFCRWRRRNSATTVNKRGAAAAPPHERIAYTVNASKREQGLFDVRYSLPAQ